MPTYNIVNPAESLQTVKPMSLGEMINIGAGMQQYQAGQLQLQQAQREANERQPLADFMANQSNYMDEQGNIDLNKATQIFKIAPNLGADTYGKMVTLANNQTIANNAKLNLNQDILSGFGNVFMAAANSGDNKQQAITRLRDYANTLGVPAAKQLADAYIGTLSMVPEDQNFGENLRKTGLNFMTPEQQTALYGPNVSLQPTEAGTVGIVTQRNLQGGVSVSSSGQPVVPTPFTVIGQDPVTGQNIYEGYDPATGRLVRTLNPPSNVAPESGATQQLNQQFQQRQPVQEYTPPSLAQQQGAQAGPTYLTEANAARASVKSASDALNNIDVITKYLPSAYVGGSAAASAKQFFSGQLGGILSGTNEIEAAAAAREIVQKNIAGLVAQANAAGNGKYASDLQQQADALASAEKTPTAIYSSLEQLRPLLLQTKNYSQGLDAAIKNNPQKGHLIKPEYDSAMNKAYDPVVVAFHDIYQRMGGDKLFARTNSPQVIAQNNQKLANEFQKYANEHKISQAQINNAKGKIGAYNSLVKGIIP